MTSDYTPWKVMVVDDEATFRNAVTRFIEDLSFEGRLVETVQAASGVEARQLLREHDDIAVIILDVMMESPEAGFELVRTIRESFGNHAVRIILASALFERSGVNQAITTYDVDDAIEKENLLDERLRATVIKALRGYRDILRVTHSLSAGPDFLPTETRIIAECDRMLASCLATAAESENCLLSGLVGIQAMDSLELVAGCGDFADYRHAEMTLPRYESAVFDMLSSADDGQAVVTGTTYTAAHTLPDGLVGLIHIVRPDGLTPSLLQLLRLITPNLLMSIGCLLTRDTSRSRDLETLSTIQALVNTRSLETGRHVRRVGLTAERLALLSGLSAEEAETYGYAAQLHDVGKVGVPDDILHKPGHLTEMEYRLMTIHTRLGHRILSANRSPMFTTAAVIALSHHERWDGRGYPDGLSGERIPLAGRIVAICDVFDAITHDRSYRKAMTIKRAVGVLNQERGRAFDPRLIDLFLDHIDEFLAIGNSVNDYGSASRFVESLAPFRTCMTGAMES